MRIRSVALIFAAALVSAASATSAPAQVHFGLEGGASYAGVSGSLFGALFDQESAFRPTWSAGVTLDVPLAERVVLATGLRYLEYGEQLEVTWVEAADPSLHGTFEIRNTWRYLAIPARVKYQPLPGRGPFVSFGPEIEYLLELVNETEIAGQELANSTAVPAARSARIAAAPAGQIFEQVGTFDDFKKFYSSWNVALVGGLGYEFPLMSHAGVIEVRYSEGILDMAKSSSVTQRTRGIEAVLGLRW